MNDTKKLLDESIKSNWIPKHDCKRNLQILSETHSVNSLHNIVIARTSKCIICGKKFEESDPDGIKS